MKEKIWLENGVVQGSPISLLLFNIYLDEFLRDFENEYQQNLEVKSYADDLIFIIKHKTNYKNVYPKQKMLLINGVNKKKSCIFVIKNHLQNKQMSLFEYPVDKQYAYLGIAILNKSSLKNHIKKIEQQLKAKESKLKWITRKMPLNEQIRLWKFIQIMFLFMLIEKDSLQIQDLKVIHQKAKKKVIDRTSSIIPQKILKILRILNLIKIQRSTIMISNLTFFQKEDKHIYSNGIVVYH